jgi:hypothetical protein
MAFWKQKFAGIGDSLPDALSKAAQKRGPGWYRVVSIKVKETNNPITEYSVVLEPTTPPEP